MKKAFAAVAVLAVVAAATGAQEIPRGNPSVVLGGKQVSVDYGRPSLKGRTLDQLLSQLPADRMWRAGANQVTTLTAEVALAVGEKTLKAGKYSLYVHVPASGDWSLVFNTNLGVPLGQIYAQAPETLKDELWPHLQDYDKNIGASEVLRVPLQKLAVPTAPVEQLTIDLVATPRGARLTLSWGDRAWALDFTPAQ